MFAAKVVGDLFVKAVLESAVLESVQAFSVGVGADRDGTETAERHTLAELGFSDCADFPNREASFVDPNLAVVEYAIGKMDYKFVHRRGDEPADCIGPDKELIAESAATRGEELGEGKKFEMFAFEFVAVFMETVCVVA